MDLVELVQSADIVEYIAQYVELELRGNEYWGLSPFKDEKTPSFSIRQDPPFFYDYSSGIGGNILTFIKEYHGVTSKEAVEILKKHIGCEGSVFRPADKMTATIVSRKFAKQTSSRKENTSVILPDNVMERYEKREDALNIWKREGISDDALTKFGVHYDAFSNRLVYPIYNLDGKIVNIGGRTIDPDFKEKKMRKYTYFYPWGSMNVVYGLFENMQEILQKREVIVFEGCKSVLIAHSWGIKNTCALLTSHMNPNQMKLFAKLGCTVVLALDRDVDIRLDKQIEKLKRYTRVEFLQDTQGLLQEKDAPVDRGREVFDSLYENRRRLY